MLRHFLASAARTTTRSVYRAQSTNKPAARVLYQFEGRLPEGSIPAVLLVGGMGAGLAFLSFLKNVAEKNRPKTCLTSYDPMPKIVKQGAESNYSIKKTDPFEAGKIAFSLEPTDFGGGYSSEVIVESFIDFELPYPSVTAAYGKICNELNLRGIHVDRSEEGARLGLTAYALKYMQKGVEEHAQRKCKCCRSDDATPKPSSDGSCEKDTRLDHCTLQFKLSPNAQYASPEQSDKKLLTKREEQHNEYYAKRTAALIAEFSNGQASFELKPIEFRELSSGRMRVQLQAITILDVPWGVRMDDHREKFCDELKRRGIHVEERTEEGVRRGLTQFALQYMQKGVEERTQKICRSGTNSATSKTPPL